MEQLKKSMMIKLSENLRNGLKARAVLENKTMNEKVVELIKDYLKK